VIYLDSIPGKFTHDKPQAPYHMVTLGYIIKKSGGNGTIYAKVQNGYELDELHNVRITAPVLNKSVIIYDSVRRLWVDTTVSAAGLGLGGSGTTNYVSKWTGSTALGNSLIQDDGSNVGIGTAPTTIGAFRVLSINSSTGSILDLLRNGTSQMQIQVTSGVNAFAGQTNLPMAFSTNGSNRMQIFGSTGNISIGYGGSPTDAGFKVDISGTFRSTLDANINGLTVGRGGGSNANNTAVGFESLLNNTTGFNNTAIGYQALKPNTTGFLNTAIGYLALASGTTAGRNVAVGFGALFSLTNQDRNVAVGNNSLSQTTTGFSNTAIGDQAGNSLTTGNGNTFVGSGSTGNGITTGQYNTIIGAAVSGLSSSLSNTIILADGQGNQRLVVNSSNQIGLTGQPVAPYPVHIPAVGGYGLAVRNTTTTTKLTQVNDGAITLGDGSGNYSTFEAVGTSGTLRITSPLYQFRSGSNTAIYISSTPNVLIGTTTDAGYKLDVNGTARVSGAMGVNAPPASSTATFYVSSLIFNKPGILIKDNVGGFNNSFQIQNSSSEIIFDVSYGNGFAAVGSAYSTTQHFLVTQKSYGPIGLVIRPGASGFIHDLMQLQDASSTVLSGFTQTGLLYVGNNTIETSAALSVKSTTRGFLPPRMTNAQMVAIATPAAGLVVYDTTNNKLNVYDGTNWVTLH
jgi:hypothetical protein